MPCSMGDVLSQHALQQGGCLVGGMPGEGGWSGGSAPWGEGCLVETPRMATAADGTHPMECIPVVNFSGKAGVPPRLENTGSSADLCGENLSRLL